MPRSLFSLTLLAVGLLSSVASAKDGSKATVKAAKKACAAGDFRTGVDILAGLYVETNEATHIFNQGRCYEQNHQWQSAIDRFREYLRNATNMSPEDRAASEKHIAECRRYLAEEAPPPAPAGPVEPAVPAAAVAVPPAPAQPPLSPPAEAVVQGLARPTEGESRPGSGMRTAGLLLGGAGVVALTTAIILNLKANDLAHQANNQYDPAAASSQKSYRTGAVVCYVAGGATLAAGAVLYLIGYARRDSTPRGLAVLPVFGSDGPGVLLQGNF
jgi:hypothetical protein